MIRVIFFDLGGVIFQDFFSGGAGFFAQKFDLPVEKVFSSYEETDDAQYCKDEMTDEQRWTNFAEKMRISKENVPVFINEFYESYQLFPESVEFLKKLQQTYSSITIGVLSDQPLGVSKYLREKFTEVFELFNKELILISANLHMSKKDPGLKIYEEAIKRSNANPKDILFVDNSLQNVENAKKVGMNAFFFDIREKSIEQLTKEIEDQFL